jgi:rSAM/selenodomain-associated transferase 1
VKTRLIPALGLEGAARLAAEMLRRTIEEALAARVGAVELCADPDPDRSDWCHWRPAGVELSAQGSGDLGDRLARASRRSIDAGNSVLLIGTDCPGLDHTRLAAAAEQLESHDAVLHATEDGGYALLGLRRFDPSIFSGIAWSTPSVSAQTIERIRALGWRLHVGATLRDVDVPADLA